MDNLSAPTHIGLVLDGNRRWAKANGLPTFEGHRRGAEVFKDISFKCFDYGVKYLSAYVFSTENWSRTKEEVAYLMRLLIKAVELHLEEFNKKNIKIVVLGSRQGLDKKIVKLLENIESKTCENKKATLALCFNYGGKQEIVDAVNCLIDRGETTLTKDMVSQSVYHPEIPELDLLIRTSGENRTSGFMLWRSDYAELYFCQKLWPDFSEEDLKLALTEYANRERRYGK